ncbi:aspartate aminotransferase family protein [Gallibacterium anatis]|uniref:aspartate aminotransferase family protein n=1 Tax=Gallibacterium anatis TaxID=750 RepID=UPI0030064113
MSDLHNPASQAAIDPARGEQVYQDDRDYVFHSWSAQAKISPVPIAGAQGSVFWDYNGKEYLDFASQLVNVNLGHRHPKLIKAIQDQLDVLPTIQPAIANETRGKLAKLIANAAPGDLNLVFFTNGGADANENAVRMARLHTGRRKILTFYRSYHGATSTAIVLTGDPRRWASETTSDPAVVHFFGPYAYRSAFQSSNEEEECQRAIAHLENVIQFEGAGTIAAIMMETVVGTNGVLVPPKGYLPAVRAICDKYGICMICDEVMVGFGRTGKLFAIENFGVVPDLLTFAKGVNSGYVPLGGVLMSEAIFDTFKERVYPGGLTYSGHPLACAPGVATFEVFAEEKILERVQDLAQRVIKPKLAEMKAKHKSLGEWRGISMFWALELVKNQQTREKLVPYNPTPEQYRPVLETVAECKKNGVWPFHHFNRIHIAPPLTISEEDLIKGLDIIDQALSIADKYAD